MEKTNKFKIILNFLVIIKIIKIYKNLFIQMIYWRSYKNKIINSAN